MIPALEAVIKYGGAYGVARDRPRHVPPRPAQRPRQRHGQALSRDLLRIRRRQRQSRGCRRLGRRQISSRHLVRPRVRRHQGPSLAAAQSEPSRSGRSGRARQGARRPDDPGRQAWHATCSRSCSTATPPSPARGSSAECFGFSGLPGYGTGGTIHFIINNQVGFTTSPQFARSSPYPSDVAKAVQAPILHVNGDDPEAVTFACKLAIEFRQKFKRDIVIDMWCYRRFGHNEGDEPSFTQPLDVRRDPQAPADQRRSTAQRLHRRGRGRPGLDRRADRRVHRACSRSEFEAALSYLPNKADWFEGRWSGLGAPRRAGAGPPQRRHRASPRTSSQRLGNVLTTVPDGLTIHKTLQRILDAKTAMFESGEGFDWATAEALAFGSLVAEGLSASACPARIAAAAPSASATRCGSTRPTATNISRCAHVGSGGALRGARQPALANSACSASNMAIRSPTRRPWCCGKRSSAISPTARRPSSTSSSPSGEAKWLRASGLVLLLPHGYEGQGPEHSSARLERYLQLCAEDNMQVANCTTPANYFHILRRQMHRDFRKPLVMMTPKSLLRHKLAVSSLADFTGESHFRRILSDLNAAGGGRDQAAGPVLGQARLRVDGSARRSRRSRRRDRPHRAALSLPVRAAGQAAQARCPISRTWSGRRKSRRTTALGASSSRCSNRCLGEAGFQTQRPHYAGRDAVGLARDRPCQTPRRRAGGLDRRRARP